MAKNMMERLRDECEKIRKLSFDGKLRPEDIVKYAEDKTKFPLLNKRIIKSDAEHIYQHRLQLARQIINYIEIEYTTLHTVKGEVVESKISIPMYEHISGEGKKDKGYRHIESILSNETHTIQLLNSVTGEIKTLQKKVKDLNKIAAAYLKKAIVELDKEIIKLHNNNKKKKVS